MTNWAYGNVSLMDDLSQRRLAGEGPKGVARINGRVVIMVDTNLPLTVNQSGVIINKHLGLSGYECLPKAMTHSPWAPFISVTLCLPYL